MTTRSSGAEVSYTISAKDRASPTMARVGSNLSRMQGSVVSMSGSLGALGAATTGVLGPLGSLVGSFGLMGLAVTGVGLGLSLAINRFKAFRSEQKETAQAAESLRSSLILTGFSADNADSSVARLRNTFNSISFRALPKLTFEMQRFLLRLDPDSLQRFEELEKILTDLKVDPKTAVEAIGEAFQENFGPVNKILQRDINTLDEFHAEMERLRRQSVISGSEILTAFNRMTLGAIPFETAVKELATAVTRDLPTTRETFEEEGQLILDMLGRLTEEELEQLRTANDVWGLKLPRIFREGFTDVETTLDGFVDRVGELRDLEPINLADSLGLDFLADAFKISNDEMEKLIKNLGDLEKFDKADFSHLGLPGFSSFGFESGGPRGGIGGPARGGASAPEARKFLPRTGTSQLEAFREEFGVGDIQQGQADFLAAFREGLLPSGASLTKQPVVIQVGDQALASFVIETLNNEVRLRGPNIGLA